MTGIDKQGATFVAGLDGNKPSLTTAFLAFCLASCFCLSVCFFLAGCSQSGSPTSSTVTPPTPSAVCPTTLPAVVINAGYCTNTLNSTFTPSTVDMNTTLATGFQWYNKRFAGLGGGIATVALQPNGSVIVGNDGSGSDLATAAPLGASWVGTAYGGGAYFEATLSFNPAQVVSADLAKSRWPAWWANPLEADVPFYNLWYWTPTNSQYLHNAETDFFEYDLYASDRTNNPDPSGRTWGGTIHDWTHIADPTSSWGYSVPTGGRVQEANNSDQVPVGTDFTQPHRYGFLWIPATQTTCNNTVQWNADGSLNLTSGNGVGIFFFDGVPFKTSSQYAWCKYDSATDTPAAMLASGLANNWTFGVLDRQHLVLTFGSGGAAPMTVYSVVVWQKDATGNVTNGQTVTSN